MGDTVHARIHALLYALAALLLLGQAGWHYLAGEYTRILLPAILVLVLVAAMLAVSGSNITSSDPLISLSYLTGTFQNNILSQIQSKITAESSKLQSTFQQRINGMSTASGMQTAASATHTAATVPAGSSYTVPTNSEVLFLSGTATVTSAGLADVTDALAHELEIINRGRAEA